MPAAVSDRRKTAPSSGHSDGISKIAIAREFNFSYICASLLTNHRPTLIVALQ